MNAARDAVPILMYHEVTSTPHPGFAKYSVPMRSFAAQMRWLAMAGYRTIDLATLLAHRRDGTPVPPKSIIITFDDGFRDAAVFAGRVMAEHGFSATFFLVAGLMGATSTWLQRERGLSLPIMSWDNARALGRAGHRCESHSVTHPRLAELAPDACRDELTRSRDIIEAALGHPVRYAAYPFGSESPAVRAIARDCGYDAACGVAIGLSTADDDPLALRRVPVLGTDSLVDFMSRLTTAYAVGDRLRALARRMAGGNARARPPR
jgi:peptidoglycan/xylan/chitin deacetylase (PgdA/CDA1 family)